MSVAFAALIHSGFSLGASMLALLSGHSLSRKRSHMRLLGLAASFVTGSFGMILLLILALTYASLLLYAVENPIVNLVIDTVTMLVGIWVLFFYYRRGLEGTALWLPRSLARYLNDRTKHTKSGAEAFVLGAAGVIYELPVTIWLMLIAATSIGGLSTGLQIPVAGGYALIAVLTLFAVFVLIGGGHTAASLTRFRARNKRFLQVIIGLSMVALGGALFWSNYSTVVGALPW